MDNFNLKKYLAEGKLIKEDASTAAKQIYTNKPLRNLVISYIKDNLKPGQNIDKIFEPGMEDVAKEYIKKYVTEKEPNYKSIADKEDDIHYWWNILSMHQQDRIEEALLNENAPGYDTRKFGEALPTLESVKAAHEAKEDEGREIKEERFDGEREMMMHIKQYRDGMIDGDDLVQAFEEIINGKVTPPGYNTRYGR